MKTYQDILELQDSERMDFVRAVINDHKNSDAYKTAKIADAYDRQQNTTITRFRKVIYSLTGRAVDDLWSSNYKLPSAFFKRFVSQECQFLLGNGVTWENDEGERLGTDFDSRLQEIARSAIVCGQSFGFYDNGRVRYFSLLEFAPLYDEENGSIRAGVRFWQLADNKPLRATFYEEDGYTDYIWRDGKGEILHDKRPYILSVRESAADGTEIYDGENYPAFPIVPMWGNPHHQSEILSVRAKIDAYDLIESGFANDLDNAQIFWVLHNAGGMDDIDLAQFLERLHIVGAASVDDAAGTAVDAHTVDIPHESREKLLERLEKDLYKDYMALDTQNLASGAATATQIRAAYEPLNSKADELEYCVLDFLHGIMHVAGIEDNPTFTRSIMVNVQEEVQSIVMAAPFLDEDYVTEKIMTIYGDADRVQEALQLREANAMERIDELGDE